MTKEVPDDGHVPIHIPDDPSLSGDDDDDSDHLTNENQTNSRSKRNHKSTSVVSSSASSTCSTSSKSNEQLTTKMKMLSFIDTHRRSIIIATAVVLIVIIVSIVAGEVSGSNKGNDNNQQPSSSSQLSNADADNDATQVIVTTTTTTTSDGPTPSPSPTSSPSTTPTGTPSFFPSDMPSTVPSEFPSDIPSMVPSEAPSQSPTARPSFELLPANPLPNQVDVTTYFNYDSTSQYGPHNWKRVDTSGSWLGQFGKDGWGPWKGIRRDDKQDDLTKNICNAPNGKQSPKDLTATIENGWNCSSIHEIRTKCGVDPLHSDIAYQKLILPHKLSIVAKGRPCLDVLSNGFGIDECRFHQPPMVDYPRYSAEFVDYADMHHFDIKYPGEHTIDGVSFDAEIQIFHVHLEDGRFSSIGIPIRATNDGFNQEFQYILDEFQRMYDINAAECGMISTTNTTTTMNTTTTNTTSHNNQDEGGVTGEEEENEDDTQSSSSLPWWSDMNSTSSTSDNTINNDTNIPDDARKLLRGTELKKKEKKKPQNDNNRKLLLTDEINKELFNPYSDAFMTTIFFYRYDGSITEPPCRTITWWVMKDPMYINLDQLAQLRNIMFTHVDRNCQPTSVHNQQNSVARPLHEFAEESSVEYCKEGDFRSDADKGRPAGKQCRHIDMPEP